ncbi:MAG: hypothetical protein IJV48_07365 [Ruminococcus sp.]|nr:hypothetical protein [Ruminococcus sp.]
MNKEKVIKWFKAALLRALRTFAQTAAATIGVASLLSEVSWAQVLSASALAALLSLIMSVGGLPEVKEGD